MKKLFSEASFKIGELKEVVDKIKFNNTTYAGRYAGKRNTSKA
jgi:hypothetical protein